MMFANALYLIALSLVSPLILYRMLRHGRYRRGIRQKLLGLSSTEAIRMLGGSADGTCLWFHAVSVGEVNLIGDVIKRLQKLHPESPIVVSTSTDSGYDLAVERYGADRVFFCPLDFSWSVRRTLDQLRPQLLVLAELELWPNLIRQTRSRDIPVVVINGRLSRRSAAGYQRFQRWTRPIFQSLNWVECQDKRSLHHFSACGTPTTVLSVSGSLKFDNAPDSRACLEVQRRIRWAGIEPWQKVWIVGSTQEGEEKLALEIYQQLRARHGELRLVIVPRHQERFARVASSIQAAGLIAHRRSQDASLREDGWNSDRVILVDTIGELRAWWGVGRIATVGGSFGDRGGQNMLEPAGYGSAVSFGPNTRNFADISQRLIDARGAVRVQDAEQLSAFVARCLSDQPWADSLGRAAQATVDQHRGATARTVESINRFIRTTAAPARRAAS